MSPKSFAEHVTFGELQRPSETSQRVFVPTVDDKGETISFKTPKGKVVSYDESTQVLCVEFAESVFLHNLVSLNEKVYTHVLSLKRGIYGKVSDDELSQIYRPFVIGKQAFLYAWDPRFVHKDGSPADRTMDNIMGAEVKLSVDIQGISILPSIFGCALEVGPICVFKEPKQEPEPEPAEEPPAQEVVLPTFSDDEEEPSIFQGVQKEDALKELSRSMEN
jgi:hypothetical protein